MESTENNPDTSNTFYSDLCSPCRDGTASIPSIGEPSYLGELCTESFADNSDFNGIFDSMEFVTETDQAKTEINNIQSPKMITTADEEKLERIELLVQTKDAKALSFQETNRLDEVKKETPNISAGDLSAPLKTGNERERCDSNCNMEDLRDKMEASSNYISSTVDNNNANPVASNISNTVQTEMSDEENERIIQEFRQECDELLNSPEIMDTLPSIEQYKLSQLKNQCKILDIGDNPMNPGTVTRTDSCVGALLLSNFTNPEKRSILHRRKEIILILNRLLNLTSYIDNKAKLGQMSGRNTFNNGPKT